MNFTTFKTSEMIHEYWNSRKTFPQKFRASTSGLTTIKSQFREVKTQNNDNQIIEDFKWQLYSSSLLRDLISD